MAIITVFTEIQEMIPLRLERTQKKVPSMVMPVMMRFMQMVGIIYLLAEKEMINYMAGTVMIPSMAIAETTQFMPVWAIIR